MKGRAGPLGRLERLLVLYYNAWPACNTLGLGGVEGRGDERPSSCFPLKGTGGHLQYVHECAICSEDATIVIWNGSQKRRGSCIFNCSEEQSLITIIEHSESLQTHLALLIWEQESTKHKFLFCSLRQKSLLLFFFFFL